MVDLLGFVLRGFTLPFPIVTIYWEFVIFTVNLYISFLLQL